MSFVEILKAEGFKPIGTIDHELLIGLWWHAASKIQVLTLELNHGLILKGSKAYHLLSIAEEGETWARDIAPLHDYLESHFREVHLSFSWVRDLPIGLAARKARNLPSKAQGPDPAALRAHVEQAHAKFKRTQRARNLLEPDSDLLAAHLKAQESVLQGRLEQAQEKANQARTQTENMEHLQREYLRKGSAVSLRFSIASNLQLAHTEVEALDGLRAIVKELADLHRYQVTQTLSGGRLRIQVSEVVHPSVNWIEQWFGGMLNPSQLERLDQESCEPIACVQEAVVVTPDEDITLEGEVVDHRKLLAPRVLSTWLGRLDRTGHIAAGDEQPQGPVCRLGVLTSDGRGGSTPFEHVISQLGHMYISGATGSGKSVAVRVTTEEVASQEGIAVLVLDPRNQSAGLLLPQDRPDLLARFPDFGMSEPRGFSFTYHAPSNSAAAPLPRDLGELATGRRIVSFKGCSDEERCELFQRALDAVFERLAREESASVRLAIVVEEAQLFTRRLVADAAKAAAQRAEIALDRLLREGRKYGAMAVVSSQSIKDFSRDAAAIRQNVTTKVFLRNSDRELEYARDYIEDSKRLVGLRPGECFVCNPAWGAIHAIFRPSLSKIWNLSESETAAVLRGTAKRIASDDARQMLAWIDGFVRDHGTAPNMSQVARGADITSKRRLQELADELVDCGLAVTKRTAGPGQPRVIEPTGLSSSVSTQSGHTVDQTPLEAVDVAPDDT